MTTVSLQTPLTPEETRLYTEQFQKLDKEDLGIVTGEAVKPLFAASRLSAQTLSQVWALVDVNNNGFLNFDEFCGALRVIGHLQQYPNLPVTADLYAHPSAKLALLNGAQVGIQASSPKASTPVPAVAPQDVSKFSQLYDRAAEGAGSLPGDRAKEIFLKARLPTHTLGEVWSLCDRNASGSLDKTEFVMAMHLIQLCMTNNPSVNPLPSTLSSKLWNSTEASLAPAASPLSANSTGRSSVGRRNTISRLSSGVFNNASTDWSLSMEKKQQFDAIFDSLDKSRAGSLSSQVLVPFFLSSRLNQDTLASIWDLADIHNNAEFSKVEFAIAMFLIQKKNAGVELPDVIPDQLLQSPALGLFQQHQSQPQQQQQQQPQKPPHMAIPSRETKPSFQEQALPQVAQNSNNGSLSDLLALNSSFTSPSPQPPIRQGSNNFGQDPVPISHSAVGARNLHGQGEWSHNVIKEDDEDKAIQQQQQQLQQQQQQAQQMAPQQHQYQQRAQHSASSTPQSVQKNAAPQPAPRSSSVNLPQVPNFASISLPGVAAGVAGATGAAVGGMIGAVGATGRRNNDLFADAEASSQLSSATTEMANLSNQVNSLSKQASLTNEKKARAEQELRRVNDMKATIESKLAALRSTHEQNVKQTEKLEADLAETNRQTEGLNQQLAVTEGNYHATESKVNDLNNELQEAQAKNTQLKEQISSLNSMSATLQSQLTEKQQQVKQERSMVDVNSRQLEVGQITVANFQTEIQGLGEKLSIYLTKRKELDDYRKTVEEQHSQLQSKYQELETKDADLKAREEELENRNKQIEEQEKIYEQHVGQLQRMFDDLSKRKESLDRAEEDLEKQHIEYANKVQDLSERQMKIALGELPSDSKEIMSKNSKVADANHQEDVSKFVEDSVAISPLGNGNNEDEERTESEVFDKDVPTTGSQTEADDEPEAAAHVNEANRAANLADRFEGDLNEYGIPRTQSLSSSVANNPPQSVMDDAELPQKLDESNEPRANDKDITVATSQIPGHWEEPTTSTADTSKPESLKTPSIAQNAAKEEEDAPFSRSLEQSALTGQDSGLNPGAVSQNYTENEGLSEGLPAINQLKIEKNESSSDDDEFQDTREEILPANNKPVGGLPSHEEHPVIKTASAAEALKAPVVPLKDEFDDAFNGLERAADEEGPDLGDDQPNNGSMEEFEKIDHKDLDEELQQNAFTGTLTGEANVHSNVDSSLPAASDNNSNDEWDEIFAGFGNAKIPVSHAENSGPYVQQPIPVGQGISDSSSPVNRKVATTPRSLAVEELSGMGFTEQEAMSALEKCNWDLEAATNYLLDSA